MTHSPHSPHSPHSDLDPNRPLRTAADLHGVLSLLLRAANQRQLWFIMLDERQCIADPLMPLDDYPDSPEEWCDTEDLGRVAVVEVLADRARLMCEIVGGRELVLVSERLGSELFTAEDVGWARALAREMRSAGVALRAQFVLHDGGLRQITPDDYV